MANCAWDARAPFTGYFLVNLPLALPDLAIVDSTVDATGTLFGVAAFFGFLTSRFERD